MKRLIKYIFIISFAVLILTPTGLSAAPKEEGGSVPKAGEPIFDINKDRPRQTVYYTMKPFTLPLLVKGRVTEHFTLVISMEMTEEDSRVDLSRRVPRLRDNMYQTLFQMITFRRRGAPLPDVDMFKERLLKIALKVAGKNLVKGILVQLAIRQPVE